MADVPELNPRPDEANAAAHGLVSNIAHTLTLYCGLPHVEHPARIPVEALLDHGDVHVDNVAVFEGAVARNSVADHVIDGSADGFGKAAVVQRRGDRLLPVDDIVMADRVEFPRRDARRDMLAHHVEHLGGETPGHAHPVLVLGILDRYGHRVLGGRPMAPAPPR